MRCPNNTCFRQEKDNKSWIRPKLIGFQDSKLNIGELLYCICYAFLNKYSYQRIYNEAKISNATYLKIKKRIREILKNYYDNQRKIRC